MTEGGTTTLHVIDVLGPSGYAQVIEERTAAGVVVGSYVYGPALDPLSQWRDGQGANLYLADGHSGVRQAVSLAGVVLLAQRFDVYGVTVATAGTLANVIGYRGERFDSTLGQYYLRTRFYNPMSGRFSSQDSFSPPAGDIDNANLYLYSSSNPVRFTDPSGMFVSVGTLAGVAIRGGLIGGGIGAASYYSTTPKNEQTFMGMLGAFGKGAGIGAVLGPVAFLSPALGVALAGIGILAGLGMAIQVINNPNSDPDQKIIAVAIALLAFYGGHTARQRFNFYRDLQPQYSWYMGNSKVLFPADEAAAASYDSYKAMLIRSMSPREIRTRGNQPNDTALPNNLQISVGGKFEIPVVPTRGLYCIDRMGNLRFAPGDPGHPSLTAGRPQMAGGEVKFTSASSVVINNSTGRSQAALQVAQRAFEALGYTVTARSYREGSLLTSGTR